MLELEIHTSTQYATAYRDDKPVCTLARRRVMEKTGPVWRVYDLQGVEILRFGYTPPIERMRARIEERLDRRAEMARAGLI